MCLLAFLGNMAVHAYDIDLNGIYYNITGDNTVEVTYVEDGEGNADFYYDAISIPRRISTGGVSYTVTAIGDKAFNYCSDLTSVTLPNTVTTIGSNAFDRCTSLTGIDIPNSVTSIGNDAFSGCSSLTSIIIPESVTTIGEDAFWLTGLTSITIPNSVISIGKRIIAHSRVSSIIVEEGNTKYDSRDNCNAIIESETNTLIVGCSNTFIPNTVTTIGECAFERCGELTSIIIPNNVTSIANSAFYNCVNLTSVTIPNTITSIGDYMFSSCYKLASVNIPNSVTSIGVQAFRNCSSLSKIEIPNSVTSIGESAFNECGNLVTVKVDIDSPLTIDENTFSNRTNATLYVPAGCKDAYEDADYWTEFNEIVEMPGVGYEFTTAVPCNDETANLTFKVTSTRPWEVEVSASPEDITGALTIPATVQNEDGIEFAVKSIGKHAFDGWERENAHSMTSVTIAEGITTIDTWAFQNCPELETVILPESVENIYGAAFAYSPKLATINLPSQLTIIYDWTFTNCSSLKSINIPEGVTTIMNNAFMGSGIESIKFPSTLTEVYNSAFHSCANLKTIDFTGCSAMFDYESFKLCNSLEEIYVPHTVKFKNWNMFAECRSLKKAVFEAFEDGQESWWATGFFGDCSGLEEVVLPSTSVMKTYFFARCTSLKSVTFLDMATDFNKDTDSYYKMFASVPLTQILFTIPDGTANAFLSGGYMNLSDKSALPQIREEFEAEVTHITEMMNATSDGDKTTLTTAIITARTNVNNAEDYLTIYSQITAIKDAAKVFLTTATLTENFDVTGATIVNPDINNYPYMWNMIDGDWSRGLNVDRFENDGVVIDHFIQGWNNDSLPHDGDLISQTITKLPAGVYRLEADVIATNQNDATAEVTGVSLFAGNQSTPVATENEKPQHFSVKFENSRTMDVTIGINSSNTNANWVAMDNVRLYYEGKAADIPQGADLVSDENARLYLYNVETGKYLSAGHAFGTHAMLDETGLPLRLTQDAESGLWQIYFWEGSADDRLLFQQYPGEDRPEEEVYVDYDSSRATADEALTLWSFTETNDGSYLIQNMKRLNTEYWLGNVPTRQDYQNSYSGVSWTDLISTATVNDNSHWLLFTKDDCDGLAAKHRLMNAIIRMEASDKVNDELLESAYNIYENADATVTEIIDITTLLNSQMGMPKTDEPIDMTALIINPRFENNTTEGWTGATVVGGRSDATSNQEQEFYMSNFNMYQVITGVPNGRYLLKWEGFHRPGGMDDVVADYLSGTNNASAVVYANDTQKTMLHLGVGMTDEQVNGQGALSGGKYVPYSMEDARAYFDAGLYADQLEVEVTDNVLTIGVKNTQPMGGEHWVIFSDFELYIMENAEQLYHKLTADDVKCVPGCLTTFNVNLLNRDDVTAFQFDVELPEGVSIYEENGQKEAELTNRGNGHMFQCIKTDENTYQFSALSLASKSFKKNEGPIVRMTLTTDGSKELDDYPIKVKNTELSKPNGMMVLPFDFTSTLTIKAADPGDVNGDGKITVTDAVYVFKYVNGETPEHFQKRAADVNNSNSITINDAVQIVNMILGNGQTMSSRAAKKLLRQLAREY